MVLLNCFSTGSLCEITMILKLVLMSSLLVLSSATTAKCYEVAYKVAIESVKVSASPQICGKELNRLTVKIKDGARTNKPEFGSVSLYVKDSYGRLVTRQRLQPLGDTNSDSVYACINSDYVKNSFIRVSLKKVTKKTVKNENTTTTSVSYSSSIGECNLSDIIDLT